MIEIKRQSPVRFDSQHKKVEQRNYWDVVLEYENETSGQYLIDLSHLSRWDVQDAKLEKIRPVGVSIPSKPGVVNFSKNVLITRMNGTQGTVWHFTKKPPVLPKTLAYTDISESTLALAMIGDRTYSIAEKLSSLDFLDPLKKSPFLLQGPFSHIPCQIVVLSKSKQSIPLIQKGSSRDAILLTCSRGYAHAMVHAILDAGEEFNLQPAGENRFNLWLKNKK